MIMKKIILTLIIFAFSLSIVSAQENAAKRALAEGDYQAAIKLYKVVIATSNDETQSANIYNEIKNAQKCDELLSQANKAYKKKKYSEAKKLYQSILKYNPSDKFSKKRVSLCSNNTSQPKQEKQTVQHEYIDLGLSVMWATCNIGASKPEDNGNRYAWGETKTKSECTKNNSKTYGKYMKNITGDVQYDAATANWGSKWRMPTRKEFDELINECTWNYTTHNGKHCYKVTGPNGNSIFLPSMEYWSSSNIYDSNSINSDLSDYFSGKKIYATADRYLGKFVRPVCDKDVKTNNTTSQQNSTNVQSATSKQNKSNTSTQNTTKVSKPSNGTANGHEYVDLGLPSGLKWATCNVGATSPEDFGDYFAWGDTKTKSNYNWDNRNPEEIGDISGNPKYDAARANWGGDWRMPEYKEFIELIDNCIGKETTQNGVKGFKLTSKTNGNSIFFPAAGYCQGTKIYNIGSWGYYWSSTPYNDNFIKRISFGNYPSRGTSEYRYGQNIRPVIK